MANPKPKQRTLKYNIVSHFTFFGLHRKTNRSLRIEAACANAYRAMLANRYSASTCEVYDEEEGKPYLTIRLGVDGSILSFFGPAAKGKIKDIQKLLASQPK